MILRKLCVLLIFPLVCAFSLAHFWCFTAPDGGMAYTILYYFIVFPIAVFGTSNYIGRKGLFGARKWFFLRPLWYHDDGVILLHVSIGQ